MVSEDTHTDEKTRRGFLELNEKNGGDATNSLSLIEGTVDDFIDDQE